MNNKNEPISASSVLHIVAGEQESIVTAQELQDNNDKPIQELLDAQSEKTTQQGIRS